MRETLIVELDKSDVEDAIATYLKEKGYRTIAVEYSVMPAYESISGVKVHVKREER